MKSSYFVKITDTYGGEANYSWVTRYLVSANSELGAIQRIARKYGAGWRREYDGRYNLSGACICLFINFVTEEEKADLLSRYSRIEEI